jgi:hypothetical protein
VADPAGDRIEAIHVYRDLDGNGVLDPGSDGLLLADTTPADGYAFHAGSLPSGRHVLYVAAMKDGAVAGSITTRSWRLGGGASRSAAASTASRGCRPPATWSPIPPPSSPPRGPAAAPGKTRSGAGCPAR